MINTEFSDRSILLKRIEEWISTYQKLLHKTISERNKVDESPEIVFSNENLDEIEWINFF